MSKFLTPPVWYDKDGEENQSLVNTAGMGISGPTNIAFGLDAKSGADNDSHSCIAIGYEATATGKGAIAIGSYDSNGNPVALSTGASAIGPGTIAIGGAASATDGSLAIGDGASAIVSDSIAIGGSATAGSHQIQLGGNNNLFNLTVGNGTGTINGINLFQAFASDGQTVHSASSANMIKSVKVDADSQVSDMTITKLLTGAIYVVAVRFSNAIKGNIHSSFILVNTANPSGSIFLGSGCPFLGASASVCARYISQTPDSSGAKGKIDIVQISNAAFSTYPDAIMESICAFRIN